MRLIFSLISWISCTLLCLACSNKQNTSQDDNLITGYQLIDSGRTNEAVDHFSILQQREPTNQDYLRGLGSAFAARAGFKVQNLTGPIQEINSLDSMKKNYSDLLEKWLAKDSKLEPVKNLLSLEIEVVSFIKKISLIPSFTTDQIYDLKKAITTYQLLDPPSQGDYLYIAVLEALLLKSVLLEQVPTLNCKQFIIALQDRFLEVASSYSSIIHHMKAGQPSRNESFAKQEKSIALALKDFSSITSNAVLAISAINIINSEDQLRIFTPNAECR